jgi:hypothetical protein
MTDDSATKAALAVGSKQAKQVVNFRNKMGQARQARIEIMNSPFDAATPPPKVLIAEGDSWFDYPWTDVLRVLEDNYFYNVESVAHKGDKIEGMAYGGGQLEELTRRIEHLLERNTVPWAILLSGGGNDVAGPEFGVLLNHAKSGVPGLNELIVQGVLERIRLAYITILQSITQICALRGHPHIPILVHGYDYPVPDGRGFLGGWGFLPGPWLEPGFREKEYKNTSQRKQIAAQLIDRFNAMLSGVVTISQFSHVRYVDLRNTLSSGTDYQKWWDNELHPTEKGFQAVVTKFSTTLGAL